MPQVLMADWTWTGERFESGVRVTVDAGRITSVERMGDERAEGADGLRLERRALLPGFVNAHSHAFQRGLRGRGERFPVSNGARRGSFWTWREAMYELVGGMDAERLYALAAQAYREMLKSGITTVGEFHYLHHAGERDWGFDEVLLRAARDVGIRIVLLQAYYTRGGFGAPLSAAQQRFDGVDPERYWRAFDALDPVLERGTQSLGCVVHSVRAAEPEELIAVHLEAQARGLAFHMHVEEQRQEIADCVERHGVTPMQLLLENLEVDQRFTAVHCTHTAKDDMQSFLAAGGNVCLCPLTEANLGDGVADLPFIMTHAEARAMTDTKTQTAAQTATQAGPLSIGTDSNARIDFFEELRWAELGQRLYREERGSAADAGGQVARGLLRAASAGGARSLGVEAGRIAPGAHADFVAVELNAASLSGWTPEELPESLVFGCGADVVADVCVAGRWIGKGC